MAEFFIWLDKTLDQASAFRLIKWVTMARPEVLAKAKLTAPSKSTAFLQTSPSNAILQLESLFCERGERVLLQNFSLALDSGQGVRIEGPNGSGKTTLLRIIAGLSQQYEGQVNWRGLDIRQNRTGLAAETLYIGHLAGVKALLTPIENLAWWAALHLQELSNANKTATEQKLLEALSKVGLQNFFDTPCYRLSAGQQRRVGLARLYLSQHSLWILDEPFTAIDHAGVSLLEQCIAEHLEQGRMAIVTTHQAMQVPGFRQCSLSDFAESS